MMTPEQKKLLADALMDSAIQTADEAAKLGLRDIPEGALNAACGLPDTPANNRTQDVIKHIVQDRIELRIEELTNPPANRTEAHQYAKRETELYRDLLSNVFATEGLQPNPQAAGTALLNYQIGVSKALIGLGEVAEGVDLSPSTVVEIPTFREICTANKAGMAI
jgi:hypothetical protein